MQSTKKEKKPNAVLRRLRKQRSWTQEEAADALSHMCGGEGARGGIIDAVLISRWENGLIPSLYYQKKLCGLYGVVSPKELGIEETPSREELQGIVDSAYAPALEDLGTVALPEGQKGSPTSLSSPTFPTLSMVATNASVSAAIADSPLASPLIQIVFQAPSSGTMETPLYGSRTAQGTTGELRQNSAYSLQASATVLFPSPPALDLLCNTEQTLPLQKQPGAWLALGASDLAELYDEGWSTQDILVASQVVLKGVEAMPSSIRKITRRKLMGLGAAAVVAGIPLPEGRHASIEQRTQLCSALGESIAAGWKLFHTAGNAQVLAVGEAQLILVQQVSSYLYPNVRSMMYSGVYRLIGAAQHFQGRYDEAYRMHERAYLAALEGMDVWNMAQSRGWQAYGLREQKRYAEALQTTEAALRLLSHQQDTESIRLQARLLAFGAENAALLHRGEEVQAKLSASEALLEQLPGYHEEFDRVSWLQQAGACALSLAQEDVSQYDVAIQRLRQALVELPVQWTLRAVSTALPLASALAHMKELDESLAIAKKTLPVAMSTQSPLLIEEFGRYLQHALLTHFPHDDQCKSFVAQAQRQLALV